MNKLLELVGAVLLVAFLVIPWRTVNKIRYWWEDRK
jgi:hypothetical protein